MLAEIVATVNGTLRVLSGSTIKFACRTCGVFFFRAEDGIRDHCVTGVQTCALPISSGGSGGVGSGRRLSLRRRPHARGGHGQIGRASCRERVSIKEAGVPLKTT